MSITDEDVERAQLLATALAAAVQSAKELEDVLPNEDEMKALGGLSSDLDRATESAKELAENMPEE